MNADARQLEAMLRRIETAENTGNSGDIIDMLADDAVVMAPDVAVQEGKAACASFVAETIAGLFEQFDRRITYVSAEVRVLGDAAFDRGTFSFTITPRSGGETSQETGKYLFFYSRSADDSWKIARAIVSLDQRPEDESGDVHQAIAHVALVVRDYDEAIRFFCDKLRFTLVEDTYQPEQDKRWVVIAPPGSDGTTLLLARATTPQQEAAIGRQTGGRVFLFLRTDDFWRDFKDMRSRGINFVREPKAEPYGTVAVFEDLYGNLWDLVQPADNAPG